MDDSCISGKYSRMLNGMNCLLYSYQYIMEQYQKEWFYLFAATWSITDKHERLHTFVQEKMGFYIKEFEESTLKCLGKMETALNSNRSVIIEFNPYYCPWNLSYLSVNDIHYCIVVAINTQLKKLYCVDRYVSKDIFEWDFELFIKGIRKFYLVKNLTERNYMSNDEICTSLLNNFAGGDRQIQEEYDELINFFIRAKEWREIFNSDAGETCHIIILLKQIQVARLGISYMFCKVADNRQAMEHINELADAFYTESEFFQKINIILYRLFLIRKMNGDLNNKIVEELKILKEADTAIWQKLKDTVAFGAEHYSNKSRRRED